MISKNLIFAQFANMTLGHLPENMKLTSNHNVSTTKKVKTISIQDVEFIKLYFVCVHMCRHSIKCGHTMRITNTVTVLLLCYNK